jgi:hypothetical protein
MEERDGVVVSDLLLIGLLLTGNYLADHEALLTLDCIRGPPASDSSRWL